MKTLILLSLKHRTNGKIFSSCYPLASGGDLINHWKLYPFPSHKAINGTEVSYKLHLIALSHHIRNRDCSKLMGSKFKADKRI